MTPYFSSIELAPAPATPVCHDKSLVPFEYKGAPFRVVLNGREMFIAKDVCDILGYKNPSQAVVDHCKYPKKLSSIETIELTGQPNPIIIIPESDLYRLIMRSNLPDAEQFQDWVSAVFGQLAGAYYGIGGISEACKDKIVRHDLIEELAGMLIPALA